MSRWERRPGPAGLAPLVLLAALPGAPHALAAEGHPARGRLADQLVESRVDSEAARRYLEGARGRLAPAPLAGILAAADRRPLDAELLRWLSDRLSTDLATLYFAERLYAEPRNRAWQRAFGRRVEALTAAAGGSREAPRQTSPLFVFVPGYAYRSYPETGGDFRRQRELMERSGYATRLLETDEAGRVDANAELIAGELARLARSHDALVVVSASKGGPEVALALGGLLPHDAMGAVRAWVSIGGLLRGTPLADRARSGPRAWLARLALRVQGLDPAVISDLDTRHRRAVFERLRFPPHLLILHYVGAPLSGQVRPALRRRYRALAELGPNDGLTLLADELAPGGISVTELGLDHFYRHPRIDLKTLALTTLVVDRLELRRDPGESRPPPAGPRAYSSPLPPM